MVTPYINNYLKILPLYRQNSLTSMHYCSSLVCNQYIIVKTFHKGRIASVYLKPLKYI